MDRGHDRPDAAPPAVLDALADAVAAVVPTLIARIPPDPAAHLGRLGVQEAALGGLALRGRTVAGPAPERSRRAGPVQGPPLFVPSSPAGPAESATLRALRHLGPLLAERLLGALELTVEGVRLDGVPGGLTAAVPAPADGGRGVFVQAGGSEPENAVIMLDQLRWGVTDLVYDLVRTLSRHGALTPLLTVGPPPPGAGPGAGVAAEATVAARHGAAHIALGAATALAVLGDLDIPARWVRPPAVVGLALSSAARVLAETPMPAAYVEAALARRREEYLLPLTTRGPAQVTGACFALVERPFPTSAAAGATFAGNGLVEVVPGGALVRTGVDAGQVRVCLRVLDGPPDEVETVGWDEVIEVSWAAEAGSASVVGANGPADPALAQKTPPWPGDYRLRVHATGRDDGEGLDPAYGDGEAYELVVWKAPNAPEVVHKQSDRLGHRLRGEPAPAADRPQAAYRWIGQSAVREAATVMVVTGADKGEVLRAFGADPSAAVSMTDVRTWSEVDGSWVAVLAVKGTVLAIEDNGWQGSRPEVLRALSRAGRAASMYWNVNGLSRLSLAEDGEIVAAFEPGIESPDTAAPAVLPYLEGIDLTDYRDRIAKCLVVVERFTGYAVRRSDLERLETAYLTYRIREQ